VQGRAWREEIPQAPFSPLAFLLSPKLRSCAYECCACECGCRGLVFGSAAFRRVAVAVRVCASANGFQPAVRVFGQVPTVCQAGGVLTGGPRAFVGMHGEVVKIESPSNPLRLVREFVLPAVPASSVAAGAGAGAGAGIGAGEGDLKQLRRGGGALLSARFCCSHRGALIAVAAEELVFSRPEQGSAWELPLQTTSPCDPFSLGCVFQKGRGWRRGRSWWGRLSICASSTTS
jgi:hypothetical protein